MKLKNLAGDNIALKNARVNLKLPELEKNAQILFAEKQFSAC